MNSKYKILLSLGLLAISIYYAQAQDTIFARNVNKYLSLDGKQLVIKYDLPYSDTTQLFDIILRIYYNDKVIEPSSNSLTGAWGEKVKPGIERVILWDFPNEFTGTINKVTIGIVARKMDRPEANFDFRILADKPRFQVKFENKSKNSDSYSWKFGDLKSGDYNFSYLDNPVHRFKTAGSYKVELFAESNETNMRDSIMKTVTVGVANTSEIQKYKTQRTIWLGAAVATAGAGGYCLIKSNSLFNEWKTATENADELEKKYKTFGIIGPAALVVSGACVVQVLIQTKKIKTAEQTMSLNFIPLDKGAALGLAMKF